MVENFEYDIFIAYASDDREYAERLHAVLTAVGHRVFLDTKGLKAGDRWSKTIRQAQWASLLTVALISDLSEDAYFQQGEILRAIRLARKEGIRRLVPVYLTDQRDAEIPELLEPLHGILLEQGESLLSVAQGIEATLRESKRWEGQEVDLGTIFIITGCGFLPEQFDRPSAYELKAAIDDFGRSVGRTFLRSIVMGDIFFMEHSDKQGHPNVISIGSGINALTRTITDHGEQLAKAGPDKRWEIFGHGNRLALFGRRAEDTYDAVTWFKERMLQRYLKRIWI
jgi:hypothetical protein